MTVEWGDDSQFRCVQAGKTTGVRQTGGGPGGLWVLLGV